MAQTGMHTPCSRARKIITTTTVSRLHNVSSCSLYEHVEECWDRDPKTDYTYSRSGSYSPTEDEVSYVSPNMSRRRIRCGSGRRRSASPAPHRRRYSPSPCRGVGADGRRGASPQRRRGASPPCGSGVVTGAGVRKKGAGGEDTSTVNIHNVVNLSMSEAMRRRDAAAAAAAAAARCKKAGVMRGGRGDGRSSVTRSGRAYGVRSAAGKASSGAQPNSSLMELFSRLPNLSGGGGRRSCSRSSSRSRTPVRFRDHVEEWSEVDGGGGGPCRPRGWFSWLWGGGTERRGILTDRSGGSGRRLSNGRAGGTQKRDAAATAAYRRLEKRKEYAGEPSPYKENALPHLYGLDDTDCDDDYDDDVSDYDSDDCHRRRHHRSKATVFRRVCSAVTYPVRCLFTTTVHSDEWTSSSHHESYDTVTSSQRSATADDTTSHHSVFYSFLRLLIGLFLFLLNAPSSLCSWVKSRFTGARLSSSHSGGSSRDTRHYVSSSDTGGSTQVSHHYVSSSDIGGSSRDTRHYVSSSDIGGSSQVSHHYVSSADTGGLSEDARHHASSVSSDDDARVSRSVVSRFSRALVGLFLFLLNAPSSLYCWTTSRFTAQTRSSRDASHHTTSTTVSRHSTTSVVRGAGTSVVRGATTAVMWGAMTTAASASSIVSYFSRLCAGIFLLLVSTLSTVCRWMKYTGAAGACCMSRLASRLYCFVVYASVADMLRLSRKSRLRRRCAPCCLFPLILLPLLLLGGYYVHECGLPDTARIIERVPLLAYFSAPIERKRDELSDAELDSRLHLMAHNLEQQRADLAAEQRARWGAPPRGDDTPLGLAHCAGAAAAAAGGGGATDFERLIRRLVREEMATLRTADGGGIGEGGGGAAGDTTEQGLAAAIQIKLLQEKLDGLVRKSESLSKYLTGQIDQASFACDQQRESSSNPYVAQHTQLRLSQLHADTLALKQTQLALLNRLRLCCRDDAAAALLVSAGVEQHLAKVMLAASAAERRGWDAAATVRPPGGRARPNSSEAFAAWLDETYVSAAAVDARVAALAARLQRHVGVAARAAATQALAAADAASAAATASQHGGTALDGGYSDQHIDALIMKALAVYDADKTGKVDFALESAGGSVLSTRCSQTYHRRTAQLSLFGVPLWYASNSARTVIQPGMHPGQCWAFRGATGYVVLQLAGVVRVTAVSLEHIAKALSPSGNIDSAPRHFSVWGLDSEADLKGALLGNFTYLEDGQPLQFFNVDKVDVAYRVVELRILSNHGNKEYTCLYRFRVHGRLENW